MIAPVLATLDRPAAAQTKLHSGVGFWLPLSGAVAAETKLHSGVGFCLPLSGAVAAETKLHSGVGVCLLNEMGCRS